MASSKVLTDSVVKNLKPVRGTAGWREVSDGGCRGLRLRISPNGDKVWGVRLMVHGKRDRHLIGVYPEVGLAEARERARAYKAAAREGQSPEVKDKRDADANLTVSKAHKRYMTACQGELRDRTITSKQALFNGYIEPLIGRRLVSSILREDVAYVFDTTRAKGLTTGANRVFSELMALLRWCEQRELVTGVPTFKNFKVKETPRNRTLNDGELTAVWQGTDDVGPLSRDYLRMLILSGQRRDEVRLMRWDEIRWESRFWYISADRYKTHQDHVVPLTRAMMAMLRRLWGEQEGGPRTYVFRGRDLAQVFNGPSRAIQQVRRHSGVADFTNHDFRRTLRSGLARLGVDERTAEMVIGHTVPKIKRTYDVYERIVERRHALEAWGYFVGLRAVPVNSGLIEDRATNRSNVVRLAAAG